MAKVIINRELSDMLTDAVGVIDDANTSVEDLRGAITNLEDVQANIADQERQGKDPTKRSRAIKAAIPATIGEARDRVTALQAATSVEPEVEAEVEEDVEDTSTPYEASVTQSYYDVTLNEIAKDPSLDNDILDFAERLSDYVDTEDATAEFTIKFKGGSGSLGATASGYTITVNLPATVTSQEIFEKIAPTLVRFYDEMDSDYDSDVDEFLMDI